MSFQMGGWDKIFHNFSWFNVGPSFSNHLLIKWWVSDFFFFFFFKDKLLINEINHTSEKKKLITTNYTHTLSHSLSLILSSSITSPQLSSYEQNT